MVHGPTHVQESEPHRERLSTLRTDNPGLDDEGRDLNPPGGWTQGFALSLKTLDGLFVGTH